jgi:phage terminase large subunit-like protein
MAWAVGNAKVEPRGNAIVITKQTSGTAKIDPLIVLSNAVAIMSMIPEAAASGSIDNNQDLWNQLSVVLSQA